MHFAVGMCGGAALTLAPCLILRRGWRWIPVGMTLGGLWGLVPDLPRLWREDFTGLPFAATLGSKDFELWLHSIGDLFFMHRSLDAQPKEFALLGLAMIIGLYNLCLLGFLWQHRRTSRQRLYCCDGRTTTYAHNSHNQAQIQSEPKDADISPGNVMTDPAPVVGQIGLHRSA